MMFIYHQFNFSSSDLHLHYSHIAFVTITTFIIYGISGMSMVPVCIVVNYKGHITHI